MRFFENVATFVDEEEVWVERSLEYVNECIAYHTGKGAWNNGGVTIVKIDGNTIYFYLTERM